MSGAGSGGWRLPAVRQARQVARLGCRDRNDVSVWTLVDGVPASLPVVRHLRHANPGLCGLLVHRVDIVDRDPDLRATCVLPRLRLCEVEDHVFPEPKSPQAKS